MLDETILLNPCSAYLFAIGAHGLRHLFCPHLKPHKGYRKAISLMRLKAGTKQVAQPVSAYREEIGAARLRKDSGGHYKACSPEEGLATC